ncbi:YheT family hydrolase [Archangium sp.]|uniref:YheT family hydrolase n=1 Tax=Archangium sp. TaxID=1872627 RepID=UPI002D36D22A|nr:alpha/beta fold hydrolase [Archangium sp.]HYO59346.1 alpha/beta fold hydrolase [Archangium sp.]
MSQPALQTRPMAEPPRGGESLTCYPAHLGHQAQGRDCALLRDLSAEGALLLTQESWAPGQPVRLELKLEGVRACPDSISARVVDCQPRLGAEGSRWRHQVRVSFAPQRILGRKPWPAEGHLQTLAVLLPLYVQSRTPHTPEEVHVPVKEGALLARTHWLPGRRPLILLLHGVAGTSENLYMRRAAASCLEAGYHAVRLNLRGTGEGRWLAHHIYHTCMTDDLDAAVRHFSLHPRVSGVLAVGFSLGGNMALATAAAPPPGLSGVASISAPMDLDRTVVHLERSQPLYHQYVLRGLQEFIRQHHEVWPHVTPAELVKRGLRARTIREFDDQVMAPHHGFAGVADYYARTSCGVRLPRAQVPCAVIHADDDPMVPLDTVLPYVETAADTVSFVRLPRGGHVGFFDGWGRSRWQRNSAMQVALSWARELLPPPPSQPPTNG